MKKVLFISLVSISFMLNGQNLPISSTTFAEEIRLKSGSEKVELSEFNKTNYSKVWMKSQDAVIGYIGDNYQRIYIRFISVIKNQFLDNEYFVYGRSKVKSNVCDFQGKFIITDVLEFNKTDREALYNEALKQGDQDAANKLSKVRGFVLAEYFLLENPEQKGSGFFKGVVKSYFYVDEKGELFFDDLDLGSSDTYCNNQFVGVWQGYNTRTQKPCNWGSYRIPYPGDLDIGVGEFSPNTKYLEKGWDNYYRAYNKSEKDARKEEDFEWWK